MTFFVGRKVSTSLLCLLYNPVVTVQLQQDLIHNLIFLPHDYLQKKGAGNHSELQPTGVHINDDY